MRTIKSVETVQRYRIQDQEDRLVLHWLEFDDPNLSFL